MASRKIVIKCGNFAVLVDLHVLPLGSQKDASWFTVAHVEEVTTLVQDALDQRIRQYTEFLHSKKGCKQRREMTPPSGFSVRGENFNLVANFLKRHSNLRCVVKQDLRLFPERYVVCVSAPEDALLHHGNPSLVAGVGASLRARKQEMRVELKKWGPKFSIKLDHFFENENSSECLCLFDACKHALWVSKRKL